MKTIIPTLTVEFDEINKCAVKTEGKIDVIIDTSVYAEQRWEENFPANAAKETLFAYCERILGEEKKVTKAKVLSALKALYCFIESDKLPDFKSFCQLFNIAEVDYVNELTEKMTLVFNVALNGSATDLKNSKRTGKP